MYLKVNNNSNLSNNNNSKIYIYRIEVIKNQYKSKLFLLIIPWTYINILLFDIDLCFEFVDHFVSRVFLSDFT